METIIDPSVDVSHESNIRAEYRGSCSSSEPRIDQINFIFFFNKNITRDFRWLEDSMELVREDRHPIIGSTFYFSRQQLLNSASVQETIKNKLIRNWLLSMDALNLLVKEVVQDTTFRVGKSVVPKCNILDMSIECIVEYNRTLESDNEIEMSMEENEYYGMAPATDSSIGLLQRKIIDSKTNESCSICLEELSSGCEAFCMPCSHMFHGNCFGEWLRTSHYCPNCRYEMPTN